MLEFLSDHLIFIVFAGLLVSFYGFEFICYLKNKKIKKTIVLLISSLLIMGLDFKSFCLLLIISTIIYFVIKSKIDFKGSIAYIVVSSILVLILIKDYGVFFAVEKAYIPLGVSYYFFRLISLLIQYNKNNDILDDVKALDYYLYIFFFPIFLAGPIHRFIDFYELEESFVERFRFKFYMTFIVAFALKIVFVDAILFNSVYVTLLSDLKSILVGGSTLNLFITLSLFGFLAFLHAYFDLMLYTEMSKSVSRLLGYSVQENFNKPLLASNISMFWQRWHMSLSNWTRDYVFFPILIKTKKTWLGAYLSMLTIGIWHSATYNWIFWALAHATALNFYSFLRGTSVYRKASSHKEGALIMKYSGNIITIYFVSMIFVFVAIHDFSFAWSLFAKLFTL